MEKGGMADSFQKDESASVYLERLQSILNETLYEKRTIKCGFFSMTSLEQFPSQQGFGRRIMFDGDIYVLTAAHLVPDLPLSQLNVTDVLISDSYLEKGHPDIALLKLAPQNEGAAESESTEITAIRGRLRELVLGDRLCCHRDRKQYNEHGFIMDGNVLSVCPDSRRFALSTFSAPGQSGSVLCAATPAGTALAVLHGFSKHRKVFRNNLLKDHKKHGSDTYLHHTAFVYVDEMPLELGVYSWKTDYFKKRIVDIYRKAEIDEQYSEHPTMNKCEIDLKEPASFADIQGLKKDIEELKDEMKEEMKATRDEMVEKIDTVKEEMVAKFDTVKEEMKATRDEMVAKFDTVNEEMKATRDDMVAKFDTMNEEMKATRDKLDIFMQQIISAQNGNSEKM